MTDVNDEMLVPKLEERVKACLCQRWQHDKANQHEPMGSFDISTLCILDHVTKRIIIPRKGARLRKLKKKPWDMLPWGLDELK
jgi:hypothetical protein